MDKHMPTQTQSSQSGQREVVRTHFEDAGNVWGDRYNVEPRKMSDLDLQLRRENVHRLIRPLLEDRTGPVTILDLGCGGGNILEGLPQERLRAVGMDLACEMVSDAAKRRPTDAFMVGDAMRIPLADGAVDIVTCIGVLEYVTHPADVLTQINRVIKPGGHLIISFPNSTSLLRHLSTAEIGLERALIGTLNRVRGRSNHGLAPDYKHQQWSIRQVRSMLDAAGLRVSNVLFNTFGLHGRFGRGPVAIKISRFLTNRLREAQWVSSALAQTMVASACKPE